MFKSEEEEWSEDKTEGERDKKKRGRETERKTERMRGDIIAVLEEIS